MQDTAEDILIKKISSVGCDISKDELLSLPEAKEVDSFSTEFTEKAWWCYRKISAINDNKAICKEDFICGFIEAWALFYLRAAEALSAKLNISPFSKELPPILYSYHFPELPRVKTLYIHPIVKRAAPWMGSYGNLLFIDDILVSQKIMRCLDDNGVVLGMLDFAYKNTRNEYVDFLGIPSSTPMGLFEFASRRSLDSGLLLPSRGGGFEVKYYPASSFDGPLSLAKSVLHDLSAVILEKPQEWLLWPNLNHRWKNSTRIEEVTLIGRRLSR